MKKFIASILPILIIGCAGQAMVEIGISDESSSDGLFGDMTMRITKIELPEDDTYNTIWDGVKPVQVSIQVSDFVSITDNYVGISPGSYKTIRLTVDSVCYVQNTISKMLIEAPYRFVASAFVDIVIEENDEIRLVVTINSALWFDATTMEIRGGYEPFEGAALKIYYAY